MLALDDGCPILTEPRLKEIGKLNEAGAYLLVIADLDAGRLVFAMSLLPSFSSSPLGGRPRMRMLLVAREEAKESLAARIVDARGGTDLELDIAIECTGAETPIGVTIEADRFGGVVLVVEVGKKEMQFLLFGDVRKLVTHRFTIENAVNAIQTSADPKSGTIKVKTTNHKS